MDVLTFTIVFDAVGTLIRPLESISTIYQQFAARHGLNLDRAIVKQRFAAARGKFFSNDRQQPSAEALEKERWGDLVADVFSELQDTSALFSDLWRYYAQPESWVLFPEVPGCLDALWHAGHDIVVASNFDGRLLPICQQLPPLDRIQHVFFSGDLGYCKPDPRFYQEIARRMGPWKKPPLMIGDDPHKDVQGPREAGWRAFHLDRPRMDLEQLLEALANRDHRSL